MSNGFNPSDFLVEVKHRAAPPEPWRWEIYRAGKLSPVAKARGFYRSYKKCRSAGNEALRKLLRRLARRKDHDDGQASGGE